MLNQIVMVGRLVSDPELKETESGKKVSNLTLAVPRSYKNENGEYDTDFVDCTLWTGVAESTAEYCKKGDLIGIKGRVQTDSYENSDGNKQKTMRVVAEKVTFLSSKSKDIEEEIEDKKDKSPKKKSNDKER